MKAPAGSIFDAQEPAACQWYFSSLGLLIDLVVTALAPVLPDKVAAAHFGDSMVMFLAGKDPRRDGQPFLYVMPHAGGWGGFEGGDGEDGLINNVNGGFKDYPVEVFEVKYPALIRRLRLPPRHRRPRALPRRLRPLPALRGRARGLPLPLARALGDARRGACSAAGDAVGPASSSTRAAPTSGRC